jgi:von Willebrand factor type A domain
VFKAVRVTCVSLGFVALVGCSGQGGGGGGDKTPDNSNAGSGANSGKAGEGSGGNGGSGADGGKFDNPDDVIIIDYGDAGMGMGGGDGIDGPTCGASRIEAKQVVVEKVVEIPEEVTEEITEEVPETVTEEVTVEVQTPKPTVLYIMFDKSMSMNGPPYGDEHLWTPAVDALKSFVDDDDSAGLKVALQYFPIGGASCNGNGYKTPAVAVGTLPAAAAAFKQSLDAHDPDGTSTPTEGALRGATEFCKQYQKDKQGAEQCVAVLVTDGAPNGCDGNTANLAAIAKAAHDDPTSSVTTFAVGLKGASFTLLDEIAKKGGAPDCAPTNSSRYACDVSSGAGALFDALNLIREKVVTYETHTETHVVTHEVVKTVTHTVTHTEIRQEVTNEDVPCEWTIPESSEDQPFDQNKVNIRLTSGDMQSTTFVHVGSKDACIDNAWYYDNEEQPTRFIACDQTCARIEGDSNAQIDILLGCATLGPG